MYCKNCGSELFEGVNNCPHCGQPVDGPVIRPVSPQMNQPMVNPSDTGSFGWSVLGFFFPLVGLILFLVWKDTSPNNSKKAGKGALIGVIVNFALSIIGVIIAVIASASASLLGA